MHMKIKRKNRRSIIEWYNKIDQNVSLVEWCTYIKRFRKTGANALQKKLQQQREESQGKLKKEENTITIRQATPKEARTFLNWHKYRLYTHWVRWNKKYKR